MEKQINLLTILLLTVLSCNFSSGQGPTSSTGCPLVPSIPIPLPGSPPSCRLECTPPCLNGEICCPGGIPCAYYCYRRPSVPPQKTCPRLSRSIIAACSNGRRVGSRCTQRCMPGYRLSSTSRTIICKPNGQWTNTHPRLARCVRITVRRLCPTLPDTFVSKCTRGRIPGSTCKISCPEHYELKGANTLSCRPHRKWNINPASIQCVKIDPRCPPRRLAAVSCPVQSSPDTPECPASCNGNQICCPIGCSGFTCTPIPPSCPADQPQADCRGLPCDSDSCPRFPQAFCFDSGCGGCTGIFTTSEIGVIPRFACDLGSKWPDCLKGKKCPPRLGLRCRIGCRGYSNKRCVYNCNCKIVYLDKTTGRTITRDQCRRRRPPVPPPKVHPSCPPVAKPLPGSCPKTNSPPQCPRRCPTGQICCARRCGGTGCIRRNIPVPPNLPHPLCRTLSLPPPGSCPPEASTSCPPTCPRLQICCRTACGTRCVAIPPPNRPNPLCPVVLPSKPGSCLPGEAQPKCPSRCPPLEICCPTQCGGTRCIRRTFRPTPPPFGLHPSCPAVLPPRPGSCSSGPQPQCPLRCPPPQICCRTSCGGSRCVLIKLNPRCPPIGTPLPGSCPKQGKNSKCPKRCPPRQTCCPVACGGHRCVDTRLTPPPRPIDISCPIIRRSPTETCSPPELLQQCPSTCPPGQICCRTRCGGTHCIPRPRP